MALFSGQATAVFDGIKLALYMGVYYILSIMLFL